MKIRTDFVTNSSSSSFVFEVKFNLKNGRTLSFWGEAMTEDESKDVYGYAVVTVNPKELGQSRNVDELIKLLADGVIDDGPITRRIFDEKESEGKDSHDFIIDIKSNITSMDDIKSISVYGETWHENGEYLREYVYDMDNKVFWGKVCGAEPEETEGSSGEMNIDTRGCKIFETEDEDEFWGYELYPEEQSE